MMRAELSADRIMANHRQRIITGRLVPYSPEVGQTSVGPTTVRAGAVQVPDDPSRVKLLADHDTHDPVAVLETTWEHAGGLYGSFRVPPGDRGDRALVEAETTRDGLSVGLSVADHVEAGGVIEVLDAELVEVSQLAIPAFKSAQVTTVAESQPTEEVETMSESQTPEVETLTAAETEALVDEQTRSVVAEFADVFNARLDELAAAKVVDPGPGRDLLDIGAEMLEAARRRENFHLEAALGVTTTGESAMQEKYFLDLIETINSGRPCLNSLRQRDAGSDGLSLNLPSVTQPPTVAEQATENTEVSSQQLTVDWVTTTLKTFAGANILSVQAIERSSPATMGILIDELGTAYANVTDAEAITVVKAAITQSTVTSGTFLEDLAELAKDIAAANGNFDVVWAGVNTWGKVLIETVLNGPAYYDGQTMVSNTFPGQVATIGGVSFIRSANLGADDFIGMDSRSSSWWEVSGSPMQIRAVNVDTLNQEIGVYGYGAASVERPLHLSQITLV